MARVCLFDVNETLLDLGALDPHFEQAFGDAGVRRLWFSQLLQSALVATVTGAYSDFGSVGAAALEMVAERQGVRLPEEDRQRILGGMRELPPHPEVRESLERLRDAGRRLRGGLRRASRDGARPPGRAPRRGRRGPERGRGPHPPRRSGVAGTAAAWRSRPYSPCSSTARSSAGTLTTSGSAAGTCVSRRLRYGGGSTTSTSATRRWWSTRWTSARSAPPTRNATPPSSGPRLSSGRVRPTGRASLASSSPSTIPKRGCRRWTFSRASTRLSPPAPTGACSYRSRPPADRCWPGPTSSRDPRVSTFLAGGGPGGGGGGG